jgi:hypothetical protein
MNISSSSLMEVAQRDVKRNFWLQDAHYSPPDKSG